MRECGKCTKCCEGYLQMDDPLFAAKQGVINGVRVKCNWLNRGGEHGCFIYDDKPHVCNSYLCEWKLNDSLPDLMNPYISNTIITRRVRKNVKFYQVIYTGEEVPQTLIDFLNNWSNHYYCLSVAK